MRMEGRADHAALWAVVTGTTLLDLRIETKQLKKKANSVYTKPYEIADIFDLQNGNFI